MSHGILVVDDHPLVRDVVRTILESRGYAVTTAKDGTEALQCLGAVTPDVAVVDVDMPGPNGVEVCAALRRAATEKGESLPVWLMTGVERPGLEERAKLAGALGIIAKPFTSEQLIGSLKHALGQPGVI
jgi:CheY-like chemotaxis protein